MNEIVLLCAFRYALGRRSFVVREVADAIEAAARSSAGLSKATRTTMVKEINAARLANGIGMNMDARIWLHLRDILAE